MIVAGVISIDINNPDENNWKVVKDQQDQALAVLWLRQAGAHPGRRESDPPPRERDGPGAGRCRPAGSPVAGPDRGPAWGRGQGPSTASPATSSFRQRRCVTRSWCWRIRRVDCPAFWFHVGARMGRETRSTCNA